MSHRHTVIEPADGLTVLIGPNNCGKSAFVRALQILCHNSPSGFVLRHDEKKCDVIVETESGDVIQWTRKRNGGPSYTINGQVFDRLRSRVPEEVHQILHMPKVDCDNESFDIHFGEQTEPVFLLRNRGRAAAQFFASSSDATHLVAMQSLHKSKVLIAKRDLTTLTDKKTSLEKQNAALQPVDALSQQLADCESLAVEIESNDVRIEELKILIAAIDESKRKTEHLQHQCRAMSSLDSPPVLSDPIPLQHCVDNLKRVLVRRSFADRMALQLQRVPSSPEYHAERPLVEIVVALVNAGSRLGFLNGYIDSLKDAHQPPEISPVGPLLDVINDLKGTDRDVNRLNSSVKALDGLQAPQPVSDSVPLASLITRLRSRQSTYSAQARCADSIQDLEQPPMLRDTSQFQDRLRALKRCQRITFEKNERIAQVEVELKTLVSQFEQWVEANPVCPTCGSLTDTDHLLPNRGGTDV